MANIYIAGSQDGFDSVGAAARIVILRRRHTLRAVPQSRHQYRDQDGWPCEGFASIPQIGFPLPAGRYALAYSSRSAVIGSTRVALRAGIHTASRATALSSNGVTMNATGSHALIPKRKLARKRVSQNAAPIPRT